MSNILITGGAGFIGSHLAEALIKDGHTVTALDNLSTGRTENIKHLQGRRNFQLIQGSVLDEQTVARAMEGVDAVYHLAAALHVKLILKHPLESLRTNLEGTETVLKCAAKRKAKTLIASTSEVYGKNTKHGLDEEDDRILGSPLKTRWGYAAAKGLDELLGYLYFKEYGVPTVIVRLFNTVGPRQTGQYGMVVPHFVGQALSGQYLTVYGTGEQSRCFLHVADAIRAMRALMQTDAAIGNVYNVGSEEEISINDLARKVIAMTGSASKIAHVPYAEAYGDGFEDMQRRFPSIRKIQALIGWKPEMNLEQILRSVIEYKGGKI